MLVGQRHYDPVNVRVLTEEPKTIAPTRISIEENLKWLVSNALPGDTLLLYYSGHGSYSHDTSGDESDKRDELIVPLDYDTCGMISDDWIYHNVIRKVPLRVTLCVFTDCCHSGTLLDLTYNYKSMCTRVSTPHPAHAAHYKPDEWTDNFTVGIEKSKSVQGNVFMFSGCHDSQTSADAYILFKVLSHIA